MKEVHQTAWQPYSPVKSSASTSGGATAADEGGDRPERLVRLGWSLAAIMAGWLDFSHDSQNSLDLNSQVCMVESPQTITQKVFPDEFYSSEIYI